MLQKACSTNRGVDKLCESSAELDDFFRGVERASAGVAIGVAEAAAQASEYL